MDRTEAGTSAGLDEDIRRLSTSISVNDTSDEEFELSSGFDNDQEGMLLLRIKKLESEIADLQKRLEQNTRESLAETAKNILYKQVQEKSSRCSVTQASHHSHLKKLVKLNAALTGIKFLNYDWEVISRDDTTVRRRYSYDGRAGSISFRITFEVKARSTIVDTMETVLQDTVVQNVQVRLNDNASDELKFRIQSLGNDLSSIFGALSQYSMINRQ